MAYGGVRGTAPARHGFPFYCENIIPNGNLHPRREYWRKVRGQYERTRDKSLFMRRPCLNDPAWRAKMKEILKRAIERNKSLNPIAYNIGDEISVTSFANPFDYCFGEHCMERFRQWLKGLYGDINRLNEEWGTGFLAWDEVVPLTTDEIRAREFPTRGKENFSSWADHRTFMDIIFAETLRDFYKYARVPTGFGGVQAPSAFGGYDWWRLSEAPGWLEPYDIGGSREIIRSFNARIPIASTTFEGGVSGRYRLWYKFLHGDRGTIIWWYRTYFKNAELTDYARSLAPTLKELESGICRLLARRPFEHNGIAIYYSQPSIQAHWRLDSEPDKKTWIRRFGSWEAGEIREFVRSGGCVIADSMTGTMDEHCKRRKKGILDGLFGIERKDFRVAENYGAYKDIVKGELRASGELLRELELSEVKISEPGLRVRDGSAHGTVGEIPAVVVKRHNTGLAVYLNVSIMRYYDLRGNPEQASALLELVERILKLRGIEAEVRVYRGEEPLPNRERMVFEDGSASYMAFMINGVVKQNPDGSLMVAGLRQTKPFDVSVELKRGGYVYDLRRGAYLERGMLFMFELNPLEPVVLSLLPFRATAIYVEARQSGRGIEWKAKVIAENYKRIRHIFRLEVISPSGEGLYYYWKNLEVEGVETRGVIPLALNDPPGIYTIVVKDIAMGLRGTARLTVRCSG